MAAAIGTTPGAISAADVSGMLFDAPATTPAGAVHQALAGTPAQGSGIGGLTPALSVELRGREENLVAGGSPAPPPSPGAGELPAGFGGVKTGAVDRGGGGGGPPGDRRPPP